MVMKKLNQYETEQVAGGYNLDDLSKDWKEFRKDWKDFWKEVGKGFSNGIDAAKNN